jgi:hypothetical protein
MKALANVNIDDVLVFDIETVAAEKELTEDSKFYDAWLYKVRNSKEFDKKNFTEDVLQSFSEKAALFPEFGKIVCISIGHIKLNEGLIKVSSFYEGCNEKVKTEEDIIVAFNNALDAFQSSRKKVYLCGHAIKAFDVPYVFKKSLILGIDVQDLMDTSISKPWELTYLLDTKELYQGTSFTPSSLIGLTTAFGIESPKQDISGSETTEKYYNGEVERIARYCERDVVAVGNVLLKMMKLPIVEKMLGSLDFADVPLLEKVAKLSKYTKEEAVKVVGIYDALDENEKPIAEKLIEISFKKSLQELRSVK